MSSLLVRRSSFLSHNYIFKPQRQFSALYSLAQQFQSFSTSVRSYSILASGFSLLKKTDDGLPLNSLQRLEISSRCCWDGVTSASYRRRFGSQSQAAAEPSTSDGLTVEDIVAANWAILDEDESDWKSHASAIAQSIHLIKKRLKWKRLLVKLEMLSVQLDKADLWDDPARAGQISREHGLLMGKMSEVKAFEQELLEQIDMIKLSREENDVELESDALKALLQMRRNVKEKELEALLAGEHDSCSCFIEVQAGAGGTESMDWASMVMQMYKKWAQRRGYGVTVVDEMPGEIAGIKVQYISNSAQFHFFPEPFGVHLL